MWRTMQETTATFEMLVRAAQAEGKPENVKTWTIAGFGFFPFLLFFSGGRG